MADRVKVGGLPILSLVMIAGGIVLYFFLESQFPAVRRLVRGA